MCETSGMLRLVFALAVGTWLGAVVSLTYLITPIVHSRFETTEARRLLRPLFPAHYALGIGCGFLALATLLVAKAALPYEQVVRFAVPTSVALVCTIVGRQVLLPRLRSLDGHDPRFSQLHQWSAMLNMTTMGALVLAMAAAVSR
jgi:hypothetical protein